MTCTECNQSINADTERLSRELFGVILCQRHMKLLQGIVKENHTPIEAIQLYYALKKAGTHPMLEWWNGKKSIDIAISRVKLNIEIETNYQIITQEEGIHNLEEATHSFKNGFTTIRIPNVVIKYYLEQTVKNILGIIQGLKLNLRVI